MKEGMITLALSKNFREKPYEDAVQTRGFIYIIYMNKYSFICMNIY